MCYFLFFFVSRVRDGNGRRRGFSDRYFNILLLLLDSTERYLLFILTKFRVIFFPCPSFDNFQCTQELSSKRRISHGTSIKKKKIIQNKTNKTPSDVIILSYIYERVGIIYFDSIHFANTNYFFQLYTTQKHKRQCTIIYYYLLYGSVCKYVRFLNTRPTIPDTYLESYSALTVECLMPTLYTPSATTNWKY